MSLAKCFVISCGILFSVLSTNMIAAQCSAVFPDVIAIHGNGGGNSQINFSYNVHLLNNPDTELPTRRVNHNSGSNINSCGSTNCSATNALLKPLLLILGKVMALRVSWPGIKAHTHLVLQMRMRLTKSVLTQK